MDGRTDTEGYNIIRPFFKRAYKNQSSMTSIKYAHLQVMGTTSGKFHTNPLKNVGGVAETRTSVDKMAKTDKGP